MNTTRSLIPAVMFLVSGVGFSSFANASPISGQGTWESTLIARNLDGDATTAEAYYDTILNITWLKDANINGLMNWTDANVWAGGLTLGGYANWRLPNTVDTGGSGCNFSNNGTDCGYNVDTSTSELSSMFYDTLGDLAYYTTAPSPGVVQAGSGLTNTGPFSNLQAGSYWSATEYAPDINRAWYLGFGNGKQYFADKTTTKYSWAVHEGDVGESVVPVPPAVWLFGSGLVGLVAVARKSAPLST